MPLIGVRSTRMQMHGVKLRVKPGVKLRVKPGVKLRVQPGVLSKDYTA